MGGSLELGLRGPEPHADHCPGERQPLNSSSLSGSKLELLGLLGAIQFHQEKTKDSHTEELNIHRKTVKMKILGLGVWLSGISLERSKPWV